MLVQSFSTGYAQFSIIYGNKCAQSHNLCVANRITFSDAVASLVPCKLSAIQLRSVSCAVISSGDLSVFARSTTCTWPMWRAGNANNELFESGHRTHRPMSDKQYGRPGHRMRRFMSDTQHWKQSSILYHMTITNSRVLWTAANTEAMSLWFLDNKQHIRFVFYNGENVIVVAGLIDINIQ